jgi:hypothetical protein
MKLMAFTLMSYNSYRITRVLSRALHFIMAWREGAGCFGELAKGGVWEGGFPPSQPSENQPILD